jgi:hypothetical protein
MGLACVHASVGGVREFSCVAGVGGRGRGVGQRVGIQLRLRIISVKGDAHECAVCLDHDLVRCGELEDGELPRVDVGVEEDLRDASLYLAALDPRRCHTPGSPRA